MKSHRSTALFALLLAVLSSIGPFSIDTFLPAIKAIGGSLRVSPVQIQQTISIYLLCFGLMNLWHGSLSDAFGRRKIILISTAIFTLASIGCAFANDLNTLLVMRAVQGLCGGAGMIVGRAVIRDCFDGIAAQKMMSQVTMIFSLAPAIAPVIGGQLYSVFGWHSIFIFMALIGFCCLLATYLWLPETHPHSKRQSFMFKALAKNYWEVIKLRRFTFLNGALAFNFAGMFIYIPSSHVLLVEHLHFKETQFFWLFGPMVGGIMLGAFLSGHLAGRVTTKYLVHFGYFAMLGAALFSVIHALLQPPSLISIVTPLMVYAMGMSLAAPSMTIVLMDIFPNLRGTASSLQGFTQSMLGAIVAGVIAPRVWSTPVKLAITMLVFCILGFLFRTLFRRLLPHKG